MKYIVSFEIETPDEVSEPDFIEWLRFELGNTYILSGSNPMGNSDIKDYVDNFTIKSN